MKKIVQTFYFDKENLKEMGFTTDGQIRSVIAIADILEQIRNTKEPHGLLCFFIKDSDLLGHRPVEILSNLTDKDHQIVLEDYCLSRLQTKNGVMV